jgi:hypothetical protein
MKIVSLGLVSVLSTGLGLFLLSIIQVSAQPLVMNTPTNIAISPEEPLPANGTVSISTESVTDTDMNVLPPEGVTVVIENDTVTVTNQTVDIEVADEDEDGAETEEDEETEENGADEGGDDGDEGGDDGGDDGDEGGDDGGNGGGPIPPF